MPPSDAELGGPPRRPSRSIDWRGWVALAWALGVVVLYGKMVVEQRGERLRQLITHAGRR
jgi:hypothetical protein